ncbi:MAG TPA: hypothetical protein VJC37_00160 [Planctomycetota bacterium]|nr:hypothetical protein [Planctomycetota bacterium]
MKRIVILLLFVSLGITLWAARGADGATDNATTPPSGSAAQNAMPAGRQEDITLIKNVFKKMEEATAKEDVNSYMDVFSKRVEITSPDGAKLSYDDIKDYLVELFDSYDYIKDEQTKELDIRIMDNTAEVVNTYRMSGIPKGEKEMVVFDEGSLKITLNKLPSFSPKIPPTYQVIAVSYVVSGADDASDVSTEDKTMLLQKIKDNYGVNLEASGGFEQYRSLLLQELKAENDANKEELEARINILKKRLQKTFSIMVKQEIQADIQETERALQQVATENEINSVVDNEIADLKDIFLKK